MINIINKGYTFQFAIIKNGHGHPIDETIKHITVKGTIYKREYDRLTSGISLSTPFVFDYVPCRDVKNSFMRDYIKRHLDPFAELKITQFQLCPNLTDADIPKFVIGGNPGFADGFSVVLLHVYPCIVSSNRECIAESELEGLVNPMRIPRYTFEPENAANPIKELDLFDQIPLSLRRTSFFNYTLQRELIEDESMYSFRPVNVKAELLEVEHKYFDAKQRVPSAQPCSVSPNTGIFGVSCEPLLSITFQIGGTVIHRKRNFGKILNTFGEVGGIFEVIMLVFALIFMCFKCYVKGEKQIIKEGVYEKGELEGLLDFNRRYETGFEDMKLSQEIVNEIIEESQDGFRMFKEAQKIRLLDEVIFEDYHKALLPLVIFRLKAQKRQKKPEKNSKRLKRAKDRKKKFTLEEAMKKLKSRNPEKTELTSQLDRYFLKVLEEESYSIEQMMSVTQGNASNSVEKQTSGSYSTLMRVEDKHLIFGKGGISEEERQLELTEINKDTKIKNKRLKI